MRHQIYRDGAWQHVVPKIYLGDTWRALSKPATTTAPVSGSARWHPALDKTAEGFRPTLQPLATFEVGAGKQYATITQAVDAAKALRGSKLPSPSTRLDFLIYPGTYRENVTTPLYSAFIGMGSPDQVVIQGISNGKGSGIINTPGGCFIENLSIIHPAQDASWAPKYPVHAGHSGTLTFINCVIDGQASASGGGGTALGVDGGWSGWIIGYKTTLKSTLPASNTNSHGPNSGPGVMADYWIDCTFNSSVGLSASGGRAELHVLGASNVAGAVTISGDSAYAFIGSGVQIGGARPATAVISDTLPVLVEGMNPTELKEYYGG